MRLPRIDNRPVCGVCFSSLFPPIVPCDRCSRRVVSPIRKKMRFMALAMAYLRRVWHVALPCSSTNNSINTTNNNNHHNRNNSTNNPPLIRNQIKHRCCQTIRHIQTAPNSTSSNSSTAFRNTLTSNYTTRNSNSSSNRCSPMPFAICPSGSQGTCFCTLAERNATPFVFVSHVDMNVILYSIQSHSFHNLSILYSPANPHIRRSGAFATTHNSCLSPRSAYFYEFPPTANGKTTQNQQPPPSPFQTNARTAIVIDLCARRPRLIRAICFILLQRTRKHFNIVHRAQIKHA